MNAAALALSMLMAMGLAGCGKKEEAASNLGAKMKPGGAVPAPTPAPETLAEKAPVFVSVFSTNNTRDPFNPRARPQEAATPATAAATRVAEQGALVTALQEGFGGVYGAKGAYFAVINDEILEMKRDTIVWVTVNGERKKLKVRPLKILPGIAELKVEGVPQTVTVRRGRQ